MKDSYTQIFKNKNNILVVLAHPDDTEIICGGLLARLIKDKKHVRVVITVNGEKGMHNSIKYTAKEFAELRKESTINGCMTLGIKKEEIFNLDIPDGEFEDTYKNIGKIVKHIREFKPDLVITHNPFEIVNNFSETVRWINHRDHRKTAIATFDAVYPYCRDTGFYPEQIKAGLKPHYVSEILISDSYTHPEVLGFEVSNFLKQKKNGLQAHTRGNVLSDIDEYMKEIEIDGGNYELLRHIQI